MIDYQPNVLACSETWLLDDYDKGLIETDSYAFYFRLKPYKWPGAQGLGFLLRGHLISLNGRTSIIPT